MSGVLIVLFILLIYYTNDSMRSLGFSDAAEHAFRQITKYAQPEFFKNGLVMFGKSSIFSRFIINTHRDMLVAEIPARWFYNANDKMIYISDQAIALQAAQVDTLGYAARHPMGASVSTCSSIRVTAGSWDEIIAGVSSVITILGSYSADLHMNERGIQGWMRMKK